MLASPLPAPVGIDREVSNYPVQPVHRIVRNRATGAEPDKGFLDYVVRVGATLAGVQTERGRMLADQLQ